MRKEKKAQVVEEFKGLLADDPDLFLADFTGIDVEGITVLRNRFREAGVGFKVIKNTLLRLVFQDGPYEKLIPSLEGPNAVIICPEDPVRMAKTVQSYNKEFPDHSLEVKIGVLGGYLTPGDKLSALAVLPPREVLLAKALSVVKSPIGGFVNVLAGNIRNLIGVLISIKGKKESGS